MAMDKIQLSQLLATYGKLLTDKQRDVLTMYCDCDCTLTEIAAEHGISRQGIRDTIVKSEATLLELENNLGVSNLAQELNRAIEMGDETRIIHIAKKFVGKE